MTIPALLVLVILLYLIVVTLLEKWFPSLKPKREIKPGDPNYWRDDFGFLDEFRQTQVPPARKHCHNSELQNRLYAMCGGDKQAAHRLVSLERGDWELAIYRLERDRR